MSLPKKLAHFATEAKEFSKRHEINMFMKRGEVSTFVKFALWALLIRVDKTLCKDSCYLLASRISTMWLKSGSKFAVAYLKESIRLIIKFKMTGPDKRKPEQGIKGVPNVKIDRYGLPTLVPLRLRRLIRIHGHCQLVTTILNMYRVMPVKAMPDFSSIRDPSTALVKTLPLVPEILKGLHLGPSSVGKLTIDFNVISMSSGSTGRFATLRAGIDSAVLLIYYPRIFIKLMKISYRYYTNWKAFCLFLFCSSIVNLPLLLMYRKYTFAEVGRLHAIDEGAGKVRVVAMIDY
jgi:hypothetical protein